MAKRVRMHGILQASSAGWKKAIQAFRLRLHLACGSVEPTHPPKAAYEWGTRQEDAVWGLSRGVRSEWMRYPCAAVSVVPAG